MFLVMSSHSIVLTPMPGVEMLVHDSEEKVVKCGFACGISLKGQDFCPGRNV